MNSRVRTSPSAETGDGLSTNAGHAALLAGLNHDLAGEYRSVLMYTTYAAKLTGPYRRELRSLFLEEVCDELAHAQFLADKIVSLGGEPTVVPLQVKTVAQPREMLQSVLACEIQAVMDYGERIRQAEEYGDVGLRVALENQVADETRHKEEVERILSGWNDLNLERGTERRQVVG